MVAPAPSIPATARATELVLAHMHLRLSALALARVELETLAGIGGLDTQGLIDLAEVRWRTGDLVGAGEAAAAALRTADADPVALIIAAEAASALGRPSEARRLASRATAAARGSIDQIFAGMPRSGVWEADANEPLPTAPTLFDRGTESASAQERPPAAPARPAPSVVAATAPAAAGPPVVAATAPLTLGFWDGDGTVEQVDATEPDAATEFEAGRKAMIAGSFDEAALRLGLALRLAPALAPAVLEATEGARAASLSVVRGDAYRAAGHDAEARQAYAIAAQGGLPERRSTVRVRPKPKPAPVEPSSAEMEDTAEGDVDSEADGDPAAADGSEDDAAAEAETDAETMSAVTETHETGASTGATDGAGDRDGSGRKKRV
jgi:hypothetical protein